jgi:branched-chain amino acid transport system ATP-binding protein
MTHALVLHRVEKRFGATQVVCGVDLTIETGERHALIGPNGAGKSTLFNLIAGTLRPSAGRITLNGADITGCAPYAISRRGLARSFQMTSVFPRLPVIDNLRCAALRCAALRWPPSAGPRAGAGSSPARMRSMSVRAGCSTP